MINRSVPLTVALVLAGGIGVTSALGSLGGDPVISPSTTIVTTVPEDSSAPNALASVDPMSTTSIIEPQLTVIGAMGGQSAPPAVSIARGDDDDDDDDDHDDDEDHLDDDHDDDDDEDHDEEDDD